MPEVPRSILSGPGGDAIRCIGAGFFGAGFVFMWIMVFFIGAVGYRMALILLDFIVFTWIAAFFCSTCG